MNGWHTGTESVSPEGNPLDIWVQIANVVVREALDPGGIYVPPDEAHRWLDALCDLAKNKANCNEYCIVKGGEGIMADEPLVVSVDRTPVVHDRTEVQLSDGATGDEGETNDGG
ncbi:MAG: hypothetical protein ACRDQ5_01105 [Sciscionella sp.]